MFGDVDQELRKLAEDADFGHTEAARRAQRFRAVGEVADLVAVLDDPHPCGMTEIIFAMAGTRRPWLNWVPMPTEAIVNVANEVGNRRATGELIDVTGLALSAPEPPSAMTAATRLIGSVRVAVAEFPAPDIRTPLRRTAYRIWRYDGTDPVPAVPAPEPEAVRLLREVAAEPWPSPLAGRLAARPLGELPLDDLLGLLAHLPGPPDTARWRILGEKTPVYWYRFLQPWVCLGLLWHRPDEPWETSTRRRVLTDLAFGAEDWVADAALFALVAAAFREPERRAEARQLVRERLDAAAAAGRLVTIEESLARLMLITPQATAADRAVAVRALARAAADGPSAGRRRRWRRR
jgi:hypothetical protein